MTLATNVISITLHCIHRQVLMIVNHFFVDSLVLQSHDGLSLDIILQCVDRFEKILQRVVVNVVLADGTLREGETNSCAIPSLLKNQSRAVKVKDVAAHHLNRRRTRQSFGEADHAHVIAILCQFWFLRIEARR